MGPFVVALVALALSAPASSSLGFTTVAKDRAARGGPDRAYVALAPAATRAFTARLRADDRERLAAVDFRRHAVVAAFVTLPTPCHSYGVRTIERRRRTLVVSLAVRARDEPCILPLTPSYHVVKIARSALGSRPARRAVLRVAGRRASYR